MLHESIQFSPASNIYIFCWNFDNTHTHKSMIENIYEFVTIEETSIENIFLNFADKFGRQE